MTVFFNVLQIQYPGYAAIFACIGLGFLFLRKVDSGEIGPGYWALSFFMNSLGFLFWSWMDPSLGSRLFALLGEVFHITGFMLLVCGAYRFTGNPYKKWNIAAILLWVAAWGFAIALVPVSIPVASLLLKVLRAVLFIWAGVMILREPKTIEGRRLAGWSLVAWGLYMGLFAGIKVTQMLPLIFGFLVGLQVLAAFGLVAMVVGRMRLRAEESEKQVKRLEGLLPICSYCKKIRDEHNKWHIMEAYIEDRSRAEFSHGICPDCMKQHHPEYK